MKPSSEFLNQNLLVPYVRECDFAIRKPWTYPERRLLDYLLVYVQKGICHFEVDGIVYVLSRGEFCLIQPGSLVSLKGVTHTVTPYAHFDVFYNANRESSFPTRPGQIDLTLYQHLMQPRLNEALGIEVPVMFKLRDESRFRELFLRAIEEGLSAEPIAKLRVQSWMTELIMIIIDTFMGEPPGRIEHPQSLNWITSYFSFHLSEPIRVADMAKRAHLSPSRFNDLFKKHYGRSPHQYLLEMRISHSSELLRNSELAQEQIAAYCGFTSVHHFSKAFKLKMGEAPGQYRNRMK